MRLPEHLIPVVKRIREAAISQPPIPWRRAGAFSVGGLTDVGFAAGSDLLVVVSHQGRGVFDCMTGIRLARDSTDGDLLDTQALDAEGIGPLAQQRIRAAGIHGGGLPQTTSDGWTTEDLVLGWPDHSLLLGPHLHASGH
jgi:hypothetical protein